MSYCYTIELLLQFVRSTRIGDWSLHLHCLHDMIPWMFADDRTNYRRYLTVYWYDIMVSLAETHPDAHALIEAGEFAVQRSPNVFAQVPVDMAIEQSLNRDTKTKGGVIGSSLRCGAVQRWIATAHDRAAITAACHSLAGISKESDRSKRHKDLTRIKRDEDDVQSVIGTLECWSNPFEASSCVVNISSGIMAPPDVANDLLQAYQIGSTHAEKSVHERLCSGSVGFFDKLQKSKLKTFSSMAKTVAVRANSRDVALEADGSFFSRMFAISTSRNVDLRMVLSFSLSALPLSLASSQGNLNKTTKSSLLPVLESYGSLVEDIGRAALLVDAMATIQSLTRPTGTFRDLAFQILRSVLVTRDHDQLSRVDFVIDRYPSVSIKEAERSKRASAGVIVSHSINASRRCPKQWKKYLSSGNNKSALLDSLVNEWTSSCYSRMLKTSIFMFVPEPVVSA